MLVCFMLIDLIMGACCDNLFHKEEIHTNQSRLKLLQSKIGVAYHTEYDHSFTYYLHIFEQHNYLERVLQSYKTANEQTEDTSEFNIANQRIAIEQKRVEEYMNAFKDPSSALRTKMNEDRLKISSELKSKTSILADQKESCMVKFEIQALQVVKGINQIKIIQMIGGEKQSEENLIINRSKKQSIYREFVFPSTNRSSIRLVTDPVISSLTVGVEDIAKQQAICSIFNFQAKAEDFGFVALRMEYISNDEEYLKEKHKRLVILQKQLALCRQGKEGLQRLSSYYSDTNSLRETFLSEPVSQYPNRYEA